MRHNLRRTRRKEKKFALRAEFGEQGKASEDGAICTLAATKYFVNGTLGSSQEQMVAAWFAYDTGAGFKIIRKSALPQRWESEVDQKARPPRLSDAYGRPLGLGQSVWLTVRLADTLYRVNAIVVERIAVEVIIGSEVLNHKVLAILCIEQWIRFKNGELPVVKQLSGSSQDGNSQ